MHAVRSCEFHAQLAREFPSKGILTSKQQWWPPSQGWPYSLITMVGVVRETETILAASAYSRAAAISQTRRPSTLEHQQRRLHCESSGADPEICKRGGLS